VFDLGEYVRVWCCDQCIITVVNVSIIWLKSSRSLDSQVKSAIPGKCLALWLGARPVLEARVRGDVRGWWLDSGAKAILRCKFPCLRALARKIFFIIKVTAQVIFLNYICICSIACAINAFKF
jgi:hypothetical protein